MGSRTNLTNNIFINFFITLLSCNLLMTNNTSIDNFSKQIDSGSNIIEKISIKNNFLDLSGLASSTTVAVNTANVEKKEVYTENIKYVKPSYNSVTGNAVVEYARHYLGLRYVSGGYSLTTGTDCSGFTKLIFQEFGINLNRSVSGQINNGVYVSYEDLMPGDLVFYSYSSVPSHVGIYVGNGYTIHESTPRDGVKISKINMNYITARRLITSNVSIKQPEQSIPESKPVVVEKQETVELTPEIKTEETKDVEVVDTKVPENTNTNTDNTLNNDEEKKVEE